MKALFAGFGSIGKRHVVDFANECASRGICPEIHLLRRNVSDIGALEKYIAKQYTQIEEDGYDVVFITNPTFAHYDALLRTRDIGKFFFIEKPIFDHIDYNLGRLTINDDNAYIAAPMRHTALFSKLKETVESHRVFSARIICSSYLPEWRPGVDYRLNYSAIREMGGGVSLDLIHEIDYAIDLFGIPDAYFNLRGHYSNLEITSDDISIYIMRSSNTLCEMHLDYFGRTYKRTCELFTESGTFVADFKSKTIVDPDGRVSTYYISEDESFVNEMAYFVDYITGKGGRNINPPTKAMEALCVALGGE